MSRKSLQMERVANSGPLVNVRTPPSIGETPVRSRKSAEAFAATLPRNMSPEKRVRIMATHYPKS